MVGCYMEREASKNRRMNRCRGRENLKVFRTIFLLRTSRFLFTLVQWMRLPYGSGMACGGEINRAALDLDKLIC